MDARETRAHLNVAALLGLTSLCLIFFVDVALVDRPGVTLSLPRQVGKWHGQDVFHCHKAGCERVAFLDDPVAPRLCPSCGEPLHTMSVAEQDALPRDTRFAKMRYRDRAGHEFFVSMVLSGRERESIHRPQRCLVGQGREILGSKVVAIPMSGRPALRVMLLDSVQHTQSPYGRVVSQPEFFVYWFVGQGRETPYHLARMFWLAWDRVFRGVAHKWAYIMLSGYDSRMAEPIMDELALFIATFHPLVLARPESGDGPQAAASQ